MRNKYKQVDLNRKNKFKQVDFNLSINKKTRKETSIKEIMEYTRGPTVGKRLKGVLENYTHGGIMGNL